MTKVQAVKNTNKSTKPAVKGSPLKKKTEALMKKKKILLKKKKQIKDKQLWRKARGGKGVVYLSHIPHGFYEEQIEKYFKQFGKVTAVSLPRSKAGKSKGYAFIEFQHPEVAQIAADTMNNYLMFNRVLKAKYIPPSEQKPQYFLAARAAKLTHQTVPEKAEKRIIKMRKMKNRHLKIDLEAKLAAKLLRKTKVLKQKLEKLGLDYDFEVNRANVESIFEKRKEIKERKASQSPASENKDITVEESDEELSSVEDYDGSSFEDMDLSELEEGEEKNKTHEQKKGKEKNETQKTKPILSTLKYNQNYNKKLTKNNSTSNETNKLLPKSTHIKQNIEEKQKKVETGNQKTTPTQKSLKQKRKSKEHKENLANNLTVKGIEKEVEISSLKKHKKINQNKKKKDTNKLLSNPPSKKVQSGEKSVTINSMKPSNLVENKLKLAKESTLALKNLSKKCNSSIKVIAESSKTTLKDSTKLQKHKGHLTVNTEFSKHNKKEIFKQKKSSPFTTKVDKLVMEVDENDDEINFKTPPNVIKKFINSKKDSVEKTPKQKNLKSPRLNVSKNILHSKSTSPKKKPRHRVLNKSVC